MLVLSRKLNESIVIDGQIRVTVVKIDRNTIRLGVEACGSIPIHREELISRISDMTAPLHRDQQATVS